MRAAVRRGDADDSRLEAVTAELTAGEGWAAAAAGCEEVHHVASPMVASDDPDEVIVPARDGTLRVLRAAREAGVRRVVLTSSFAAVGYSPKPGAEYTEADWTDPGTPGLPPCPRSKTIAERTAWDFIEHEGGDTELVVVSPKILRERLGPLAGRVPAEGAPGPEPPRLIIHNDRGAAAQGTDRERGCFDGASLPGTASTNAPSPGAIAGQGA